MTERSVHWDNTAAVGDDGPYGFERWAEKYIAQMKGGNVNGGVTYGHVLRATGTRSGDLRVIATTPNTAAVTLQTGAAFVFGFFYENDANITVNITPNATGSTRYDLIGLQANWNAAASNKQTVRYFYRVGTTTAEPALTETPGTTMEIPLAIIAVPNGFATISDDDIYDSREFFGSPPKVTIDVDYPAGSTTGVNLAGLIAFWQTKGTMTSKSIDFLGDAAFLGDSFNMDAPAGIVQGTYANHVRLVTFGYTQVNLISVASAGDYIAPNPTVVGGSFGVVVPYGGQNINCIGRVVDVTNYPANRPLCFVNFTSPRANVYMPGTAFIRDEKASSTDGGTFTNGAWQTRVLNTYNTGSDPSAINAWGQMQLEGLVLAANQITLPAGVYELEASAPGYNVDTHQIRWRDVTNNVTFLVGTSEVSGSADNTTSRSFISGSFSIAATTTFELQHRCATTQAVNGFGVATGFGEVEVYSMVKLRKRL